MRLCLRSASIEGCWRRARGRRARPRNGEYRGLPVPAHRTTATTRRPGGVQAVGRGSPCSSSAWRLTEAWWRHPVLGRRPSPFSSHRDRPGDRSEGRSGLSALRNWFSSSATASTASATAARAVTSSPRSALAVMAVSSSWARLRWSNAAPDQPPGVGGVRPAYRRKPPTSAPRTSPIKGL